MSANWNYPTSVRTGAGRISELAKICLEHNIRAPLLVTDPGLADLPMVQDVVKACEKLKQFICKRVLDIFLNSPF